MQESSRYRIDKQNINKFNFNIWLFGYYQLNLSNIMLILQIYRSLFFIYLFLYFFIFLWGGGEEGCRGNFYF